MTMVECVSVRSFRHGKESITYGLVRALRGLASGPRQGRGRDSRGGLDRGTALARQDERALRPRRRRDGTARLRRWRHQEGHRARNRRAGVHPAWDPEDEPGVTPRLLKLRCDRCGSRLREGRYVFSSWTKKRYCSDIDGCSKRTRKRTRAAA